MFAVYTNWSFYAVAIINSWWMRAYNLTIKSLGYRIIWLRKWSHQCNYVLYEAEQGKCNAFRDLLILIGILRIAVQPFMSNYLRAITTFFSVAPSRNTCSADDNDVVAAKFRMVFPNIYVAYDYILN